MSQVLPKLIHQFVALSLTLGADCSAGVFRFAQSQDGGRNTSGRERTPDLTRVKRGNSAGTTNPTPSTSEICRIWIKDAMRGLSVNGRALNNPTRWERWDRVSGAAWTARSRHCRRVGHRPKEQR